MRFSVQATGFWTALRFERENAITVVATPYRQVPLLLYGLLLLLRGPPKTLKAKQKVALRLAKKEQVSWDTRKFTSAPGCALCLRCCSIFFLGMCLCFVQVSFAPNFAVKSDTPSGSSGARPAWARCAEIFPARVDAAPTGSRCRRRSTSSACLWGPTPANHARKARMKTGAGRTNFT